MEVIEEDAMKQVFIKPGWSLGTNKGQEASRRWTKLVVSANQDWMDRELAGESYGQLWSRKELLQEPSCGLLLLTTKG